MDPKRTPPAQRLNSSPLEEALLSIPHVFMTLNRHHLPPPPAPGAHRANPVLIHTFPYCSESTSSSPGPIELTRFIPTFPYCSESISSSSPRPSPEPKPGIQIPPRPGELTQGSFLHSFGSPSHRLPVRWLEMASGQKISGCRPVVVGGWWRRVEYRKEEWRRREGKGTGRKRERGMHRASDVGAAAGVGWGCSNAAPEFGVWREMAISDDGTF